MINPHPHIAIAILNYNGKHHLEAYLPSVLANSYPNCSIWVIDNASTDESVSFLQQQYSQIHLVQNGQNAGFAEGYNLGLQSVEAEFILLLNSDIEVEPDFLYPLIKVFQLYPEAAMVQPKIRSLLNRREFEYAGAAGGFLDLFGYPFCRGRLFNHCETDTGQYDDLREVFWATGAALFIRKSMFFELGGFYPYFFMHSEEIDLCWRAINAGKKVMYAGKSTIYHLGAGSLKKENPKKTYFNFRNNLVMLCRNLPTLRLLWLIPVRLVMDGLAAIKFLVDGDAANAGAVYKGWTSFLGWMWKTPNKRTPGNQKNGLKKLYPGSVVWRYFVKKKTVAPTIN